jgi:hypothetical protein
VANDLIVVKVDKARALLAEARDARDAKKVADLALGPVRFTSRALDGRPPGARRERCLSTSSFGFLRVNAGNPPRGVVLAEGNSDGSSPPAEQQVLLKALARGGGEFKG